MVRKFDKTPDTKSYKAILKAAFANLSLSDEDQQLLFDVYTNDISKEELEMKYNVPYSSLAEKINTLTTLIRDNSIVNEERESRNLRGR